MILSPNPSVLGRRVQAIEPLSSFQGHEPSKVSPVVRETTPSLLKRELRRLYPVCPGQGKPTQQREMGEGDREVSHVSTFRGSTRSRQVLESRGSGKADSPGSGHGRVRPRRRTGQPRPCPTPRASADRASPPQPGSQLPQPRPRLGSTLWARRDHPHLQVLWTPLRPSWDQPAQRSKSLKTHTGTRPAPATLSCESTTPHSSRRPAPRETRNVHSDFGKGSGGQADPALDAAACPQPPQWSHGRPRAHVTGGACVPPVSTRYARGERPGGAGPGRGWWSLWGGGRKEAFSLHSVYLHVMCTSCMDCSQNVLSYSNEESPFAKNRKKNFFFKRHLPFDPHRGVYLKETDKYSRRAYEYGHDIKMLFIIKNANSHGRRGVASHNPVETGTTDHESLY